MIRRAKQQGAYLNLVNQQEEQDSNKLSSKMPDFQKRNWLLAYRTYRYLVERDGLPELAAASLNVTQEIQVPARMEIVQVGDKQIVMDGAHNAQKMETLVESFKHRFPGVKPIVMLAVKEGKEAGGIVKPLAALADKVIISTFNTTLDLPAISTEPAILAKKFKAAGTKGVTIIPDQHKAYLTMLKSPEKVAILTGSFYFLSQLRRGESIL
jgi:dihydrofolate synthase/folylpolyglutamate synthase